MVRFRYFILLVILFLSPSIMGCEENKLPSVTQVIDQSKFEGAQEKQVDYLIQEARKFYDSKEYKEALELAQYTLTYLDQHSQQALDLIQKIKDQLSVVASSAAQDIRKMLDSFQYPQDAKTDKKTKGD